MTTLQLGFITFSGDKAYINIPQIGLVKVHEGIILPTRLNRQTVRDIELRKDREGKYYARAFTLEDDDTRVTKSSHGPRKKKKKAVPEPPETTGSPETAETKSETPTAPQLISHTKHSPKCGNPRPATAPYNFVPMHRSALTTTETTPGFDRYSPARHTGHIDLHIEALTPIFIRGKQHRFFAIDGQPAIPGSSLRGMLRNLAEIVARGYFLPDLHFEDRRMYHRTVADSSSKLGKEYRRMAETVKSGFLMYDQRAKSYYIRFSEQPFERSSMGRPFTYTPRTADGYWEVHTGGIGGKERQWKVYIPAADADELPLSEADIRAYENDYTREAKGDMQDLLKACRVKHPDTGVPVFFATYHDGQGEERVAFGHTRNFRIPYELTVADHVPEALLQSEPERGVDLPSLLFGQGGRNADIRAGRLYVEDARVETPVDRPYTACPKILGSPKPTSFQLYAEQVPCWENTPKKKLDHWGEDGVDIRGFKLYWHHPNEQSDPGSSWKQEVPEIQARHFGGPQEAARLVSTYPRQLRMSDDGEKVHLIGSYRTYPRNLRDRLEELFYAPDSDILWSPIAPLPPGTTFRARIRFENLSDIELGALLLVMDLPEGRAHKLGLGKAIGLGSVRLTPTLCVDDRKQRYQTLGRPPATQAGSGAPEIARFKDAFAAWIGRETGQSGIDSCAALWAYDARMQHLDSLLTFSHDISPEEWKKRMQHQELEAFRDRKVLPTAPDVVQPSTYNAS